MARKIKGRPGFSKLPTTVRGKTKTFIRRQQKRVSKDSLKTEDERLASKVLDVIANIDKRDYDLLKKEIQKVLQSRQTGQKYKGKFKLLTELSDKSLLSITKDKAPFAAFATIAAQRALDSGFTQVDRALMEKAKIKMGEGLVLTNPKTNMSIVIKKVDNNRVIVMSFNKKENKTIDSGVLRFREQLGLKNKTRK